MNGYDYKYGKGLQPYNNLGDNRGNDNKTEDFKKILNKILPIKRKFALDIGCGNGRLSFVLSKYFEKVYAVDQFDEPKFFTDNIIYLKEDYENYNFDIKFDLILFWGSFYLMKNYNNALKKAKDICNELIIIGDDPTRREEKAKLPNKKIKYNLTNILKNNDLYEKFEFINGYRITGIGNECR